NRARLEGGQGTLPQRGVRWLPVQAGEERGLRSLLERFPQERLRAVSFSPRAGEVVTGWSNRASRSSWGSCQKNLPWRLPGQGRIAASSREKARGRDARWTSTSGRTGASRKWSKPHA